ncbi:MAG: 30S ribosomal protein S9, partial [Kordiimonadaceae bacterium]|nr:30S ribosomal protein S9 [Kordiimonadaceae bacterium]
MADDKKTLEDLKDVAVEAATDAETPVVDAAIEYVQKLDAQGRAYATGKRK